MPAITPTFGPERPMFRPWLVACLSLSFEPLPFATETDLTRHAALAEAAF